MIYVYLILVIILILVAWDGRKLPNQRYVDDQGCILELIVTKFKRFKVDINTLKQTSPECPKSWEAMTTDNREVYIRFRYEKLQIYVANVQGKLPPEIYIENSTCIIKGFTVGEYFYLHRGIVKEILKRNNLI